MGALERKPDMGDWPGEKFWFRIAAMQHLGLCLWLFQVAASSLLFYGRENGHCLGVASVSLGYSRFCIENGTLIVKDCHAGFEVHHYGPGALHSQADGVREGSLVVANPQTSMYSVDQETGISALVEYWRYLFHAGEVTFGDVASAVKGLEGEVVIYLVANPGTNAAGYRFEGVPLEYPSLSGVGDLVSDYSLVDVALEDSSLRWIEFVLHAHSDLVDGWTSTLERAFKLLGIVIWSVIAGRTAREQTLEALKRLSGCSSVAGRLLSAHENGKSVQEAIRSVVSSAHPLLEAARMRKKSLTNAPYLQALAIETLYYVEKMGPGRVEMAHNAVGLQEAVQLWCSGMGRDHIGVPDSDVLRATVSRLQNEPAYRDGVCSVLACLKFSVLVPDIKEALLKESMEVCQKHQLQEAIPMLFMLFFGIWDWERSGGFYQELKSCQSIEVMFQEITRFVAGNKEHECKRQNYWKLYCGGMPSPAPHFADLVTNALSCARVSERPYCQSSVCINWSMSKDVLFHCIGEALLRPMGLQCDLHRVLLHLSYKNSSAELVSFRTSIGSMRPSWHSQYRLDDAVAEFVFRNGPPVMRRALASCVGGMKLGDRTVPELPNRAALVELVKGVPEESQLGSGYYNWFGESGVGAAEVASRWTMENSDYMVLFCSSINDTVCVLEDGIVAMANYAFRDPSTADSLMRYAGPRTVGQLSRTISSQHSHISVHVDEKGSRIRVCRIVGNEFANGYWTRSLIVRWSPGRGASLFQFGGDREQTVYFSADSTDSELFCIIGYSGGDPDVVLARHRSKAGTVRTGAGRFDFDVVPIIEDNGELDSLASLSGVEVRLTEANKTNPVVRVLSKHCLNGIPYLLQNVQTWEHMKWMVRELSGNLIAAFRIFRGQ